MFTQTKDFVISTDILSRDIQHFVYFVQGLSSAVYIVADRMVNARSILGILSLGLCKNSRITIHLHNEEEQFAIEDMKCISDYLSGEFCGG